MASRATIFPETTCKLWVRNLTKTNFEMRFENFQFNCYSQESYTSSYLRSKGVVEG